MPLARSTSPLRVWAGCYRCFDSGKCDLCTTAYLFVGLLLHRAITVTPLVQVIQGMCVATREQWYEALLGAQGKLRKANISFVMSVRSPVRIGAARLLLDGFSRKFCLYRGKLLKCVEKIKVVKNWGEGGRYVT